MATIAQIRDAVNAKLAPILAAIDDAQTVYFGIKGRYWQGLWTHSIAPLNAELLSPDRYSDKPTDIAETWAQLASAVNSLVDVPIPCRIRCDVYNGPGGWGYVASGEVRVNGKTYLRSVNRGPESWRTHDWALVET